MRKESDCNLRENDDHDRARAGEKCGGVAGSTLVTVTQRARVRQQGLVREAERALIRLFETSSSLVVVLVQIFGTKECAAGMMEDQDMVLDKSRL